MPRDLNLGEKPKRGPAPYIVILRPGALYVAFSYTLAYSQTMQLLTPDDLIRLSPPEKIAMIAQLWDSLVASQLPLTTAQQTELNNRLSTLDEDKQNGVTWAALRAELEQRCP